MPQETLEQYLTDSLRKGIRHHSLNVEATEGNGIDVTVAANGKSNAAFPARVFGNKFHQKGEADLIDTVTLGDITITAPGTEGQVTIADSSRGDTLSVDAQELAEILKNYYADKSRQNLVEGEAGDIDHTDPRARK